TRVTTLTVWAHPYGPGIAGVLAASPNLARLRRLELRSASLYGDGVATLAASPHVANLTALDLSGNYLGRTGTEALANSPHLTNLRSLVLGTTATHATPPTDSEAARALTRGTLNALDEL